MPSQVRTPGTIITSGGIPWDFPEEAGEQDLIYAECQLSGLPSGTTGLLRCTDFGFSIPGGVTIVSVVATVRRRYAFDGSAGTAIDNDVYEYFGGRVGSNKASGSNWPSSDGNANYILGETNTPADINSSTFGVELDVDLTNADSDLTTAYVDLVQMTVVYAGDVPPPPLPGTGGLNTGGAFFLGMIAQQNGGG